MPSFPEKIINQTEKLSCRRNHTVSAVSHLESPLVQINIANYFINTNFSGKLWPGYSP